jgi:hypothetical protein
LRTRNAGRARCSILGAGAREAARVFNQENPMKAGRSIRLAVALAAGTLAAASHAALITNGFTFAVADAYTGPSGVGTHYHSNTGGAFGNPAGKAEVGGFFGSEEVRGLSEYNLAGLGTAGSAFVSFDVYLADGLFGQGGGPFLIDVYAYRGNNLEDLSDWEAAATGFVGQFSTAGLAVGDIISFDIDALLDAALLAGDGSLGIRLQQHTRDIGGPAYTFDSFRLTTDNVCTGTGCFVPEPTSLALVGVGLVGANLARRRLAVKGASQDAGLRS